MPPLPLRAAEQTGRPLGATDFIEGLERLLGRRLARRAPGRKPARQSVEQPVLMQCFALGISAPVSAPRSWRDPAGESPVRVRRSVRPVVSVAERKVTTAAKRTQQSLRGERLSRERASSQRPRPLTAPKATCAVPACEALTLCRGRRPHHAQRERVGTWEASSGITVTGITVTVHLIDPI